MHMCVSLLLSDVDRRLNREIGGDGVLSHTTHLGLHDNSCFETFFCEKVGHWKGFHAHELLVGCPHLSNGVDEVNNRSATWDGAVLYFWNIYSFFLPSMQSYILGEQSH